MVVTTMGGGGPLVRGICLLLSDRKALAVGNMEITPMNNKIYIPERNP